MSKKYFLVLIIIFITSFVLFLKDKGSDYDVSPDTVDKDLTNDQTYEFNFFRLENNEKIKLVDNTITKKTLNEILKNSECKKTINAGFYKKFNEENILIGLFKNDEVINPYEENKLFNGVINIDSLGKANISQSEDKSSIISLQTGPIIIKNKSLVNNLDNTKKARRMIAAIYDDKLYFITIFNKESVFLGPTLAEVPTLLQNFFREKGVDINWAINLDGGSASFYYDGTKLLNETKLVGSYFCLE